MSDKEILVRQLPGYLTHEFDGQRWFVEFGPPPGVFIERDGDIINDSFFDEDYSRVKRQRELLAAQEGLPT